MSYILDALRKSDQQRRRGGVPTLPAVIAAPLVPERPAVLYYGLVGGTVLIALGITIGWLRPWQPEPPVVAALAPGPVAALPPQAAPAALPPERIKVEPELRRHELPSATPPPRRKPSASPRSETRSMPPAATAAYPRKAAAAGPESRAGAAPQQPTNADLPLAGPQDLPPMTVAVHAYSTKPRDRLVSINDRMLREGDHLMPDLRLEQITPDGMIFTYRGKLVRRGVH
ncbi:MAG: general secretion pathway protein GspB [Rhodocyclaceae bacterium]|nr:general secretion pathway protein GspB [Rhodocyclaceae bacterium]